MGKFDSYKIDLRILPEGTHTFSFKLDNKFFSDIDGPEVQKGKINVDCTINSSTDANKMAFHLEGVVWVPCDRCLDEMELPVETEANLVVKLGKEYAEESDEIVVIPEDEGIINLAWFLYEFVALNIPIKHIHAPGKCNKMMSSKLRKHTAHLANEEEEESDLYDDLPDDTTDAENETNDSMGTDPRWDALKNIL